MLTLLDSFTQPPSDASLGMDNQATGKQAVLRCDNVSDYQPALLGLFGSWIDDLSWSYAMEKTPSTMLVFHLPTLLPYPCGTPRRRWEP